MTSRVTLLSSALLLVVFGVLAPANAVDVAVDCSVAHQTIHGFGTCMMDWRTSPNVQDLYDDPAFRHNYVDTMGMSVVRLPVTPEILFNDNLPVDYDSISYLSAPWDFERGRVLYDWSRDSNSVAHYELGRVENGFSKAEQIHHWARDIAAIGPDVKFIATPWSPPAWMKRKDWTSIAGDSVAIPSRGGMLLPQYYRHFGKFLAEWIKGMKAVYDVDIYAMSLQNEPLFSQSYNSCVYTRYSERDTTNGTYYEAFKEVVQVFVEEGLGDMKWFGAEDMTKFPERSFDYVRPILDDPVTNPHLTAVAAHGYSDGVESVTDPSDDQKLWGYIAPYGKEYWMTETGGAEWLWPAALDGTPSMLHNMLTYGRCSLVAFWQIAGATISGHELMDYDQHTKKSYSFMQFSKFIRPDAVRVDTDPVDTMGISASAYYHPDDRTLTIVLLNHDSLGAQTVNATLTDYDGTTFECYRTDDTDNFTKLADVAVSGGTFSIDMPAQSVVTLVGSGESQTISVAQRTTVPQRSASQHRGAVRAFDIAGRRVRSASAQLNASGLRLMKEPDGVVRMKVEAR